MAIFLAKRTIRLGKENVRVPAFLQEDVDKAVEKLIAEGYEPLR